MKIIIFSPTSTKLNLSEDQPIGGADTTLLKMIKILSDQNDVSAFVPTDTRTVYHKALIFPWQEIFDGEHECDLLIHCRKLWAVPTNIKYKKSVFYSQDTVDTPCFSGIKDISEALNIYNRIWVLSKFHKENVKSMFPVSDDKFLILGNAAEPQEACQKEPLTFMYCSTPFRGLDALIMMWKRIIAKYPTARLHVFSSMKIYGAEHLDDMMGRMIPDLKEGRFKGVIYHGSQPHQILIDQMKKTWMLLYPNVYPETYCNVIMEARSCRMPFITTFLGALPETGEAAGIYIVGNARTEEYQEGFLRMLDAMIENPYLYQKFAECCYPIRTWDDFAKDLLNEIKRLT